MKQESKPALNLLQKKSCFITGFRDSDLSLFLSCPLTEGFQTTYSHYNTTFSGVQYVIFFHQRKSYLKFLMNNLQV